MRIGIDLGGTKIEAVALSDAGEVLRRRRIATPRDYRALLAALVELVQRIELDTAAAGTVGVGTPGSVSPRTGRMRNANSTWLNEQTLREDLTDALGREVRIANDANCLALSEAVDGAGAGYGVVFAAILGTGCGGGIVVDKRLVAGRNGIAGEWGHMQLPWATEADAPLPNCWCGRAGCLETFVSGSGMQRDHAHVTGEVHTAVEIVAAANLGNTVASATLERYVERLGRGLAMVCDLLDPDVIVLGGGLSNVSALYERLPAAIAPHLFSDTFDTPIVAAKHGDASGVRGAAWLWPA